MKNMKNYKNDNSYKVLHWIHDSFNQFSFVEIYD